MLLKASQTIELSTGLTLGTRRTSGLLDTSYNGEELDSEQEMENYLVCVVALHKLMQLEQLLMKDVITPTHQPRVFEMIVREAMDSIVQDGEVTKTMNSSVRTISFCFYYRQLRQEQKNASRVTTLPLF